VKRTGGMYPLVRVDSTRCKAGGVLLTTTVGLAGIDRLLSTALSRWRKPSAVHDPGKIITDLAVSLALGGTAWPTSPCCVRSRVCMGRLRETRRCPRLIGVVAADVAAVVKAINTARAAARARVWALAGDRAPDHARSATDPLIVDVDATLVTSHSDKQHAAPTFKRGYGFHPLCAFVDHGQAGTGEPLTILLRPGTAGSNTAADHITVLTDAFAQLPGHMTGRGPGKRVLVRVDGAGGTHQLLNWLTGQRVQYSVGFTLPSDAGEVIEQIPPGVDTGLQLRG